jgi:hypothetical protein
MLDYIIIPPRKEDQTERGPRRFHRHPDSGQCGTAVVGRKRTKTVPRCPRGSYSQISDSGPHRRIIMPLLARKESIMETITISFTSIIS